MPHESGRASQARRLLAILDRLLLADPEAPATDSLGMYAPDERAACLFPSASSLACAISAACLPPEGRVDHILALHDSHFMDGYLRPLGGVVGMHLPIRLLARL